MKINTYFFDEKSKSDDFIKLINDPLFELIIAYFQEHQNQEIILRQLKAEIKTESNLELFLDKLIKNDLIERKNRRYSLRFPIFDLETVTAEVPETIDTVMQDIVEENTVCGFLGEALWRSFFGDECKDYFFGVTSKTSTSFIVKTEVGNEAWQLVSIHPKGILPVTLANYFTLLSVRTKLPAAFTSLQELIGDVDINYFIPQFQKVIRAANRKKIAKPKKDIFQQALLLTDDITINETGEMLLVTPIIDELTIITNYEPYTNQILQELRPLWETIADQNQRIAVKLCLFSILVKKYLLIEKKSISYFKKS